MTLKTNLTEGEALKTYEAAIANAASQPEIAEVMTELGYDQESLTEGKNLLENTLAAYNQNKTEDDETSEAYSVFFGYTKQLDAMYGMHRKKAKVVFRKDSLIGERLGVLGAMPQSYIKKMENIKRFYSVIEADVDIQLKLARLKITVEDVASALRLMGQIEAARINYLKEKGESQDATSIKDIAFAKMDDWMSEFYAIARIALEDRPQLMEALGKVVKN